MRYAPLVGRGSELCADDVACCDDGVAWYDPRGVWCDVFASDVMVLLCNDDVVWCAFVCR